MKQVLRFLTSRKLAVCLLAVTALIAVAAQIPFFLKRGLDKAIFSSWWYNGLLLFQLLNTLICSLFRLEEINKKSPLALEKLSKCSNYRFVESNDTHRLLYFIKDHLSRKGFKIHDVKQNCFMASKGDSYYLGSMIFHLSFMIILTGLILNNLLGFHGVMIIPERQIESEDHGFYQSLKEGILFGDQHQHFQIGVESMSVSFDRGKSTPSVLEAKVWLLEGHRQIVAKQMVKANQPVEYKKRRILLTGYGYSPYFTLEHNGREIFQSYVNLMTGSNKSGQIEYKDSFLIPNSKIKAEVHLYPNAKISSNGKLTNANNNLELPVVDVRVTQREKQLYSGHALMGQTMKLSNGMKLKFMGVKRYGWFDIAYNPGVYFLNTGFVLCILGLILAIFITPKRIWVSIDGTGVEIAGESKRYRELFREEFNGLVSLFSQEEVVVKDEITDDL